MRGALPLTPRQAEFLYAILDNTKSITGDVSVERDCINILAKLRPLLPGALSDTAERALAVLSAGPRPRQEFNPGVVERLMLAGLVELVWLPSPYKTVRGNMQFVRLKNPRRAPNVESTAGPVEKGRRRRPSK